MPLDAHPRLAILGAGSVALLHADAAASLSIPVTAVCDLNPDVANRLADRTGARAFTDPEALLASGLADAVVITTPHGTHADFAIKAVQAGLHTLVEKPMATTPADCRRMIDAAGRAGVVLAVGHVLHYLPSLNRARHILRSGELGAPRVILERRSSRYEKGTRPEWFFRRDDAGGGIVLNVGVHAIDKALWLGGAPAVHVTGHTSGRDDIEVETDAVALVGLANGVQVQISVTGTGLPGREDTEVICERGALRLTGGALWTAVGGEEHRVEMEADDIGAAFSAQLREFAASCRGEDGAIVTGQYAAAVVDIACSIYESAARHAQIMVGRAS